MVQVYLGFGKATEKPVNKKYTSVLITFFFSRLGLSTDTCQSIFRCKDVRNTLWSLLSFLPLHIGQQQNLLLTTTLNDVVGV